MSEQKRIAKGLSVSFESSPGQIKTYRGGDLVDADHLEYLTNPALFAEDEDEAPAAPTASPAAPEGTPLTKAELQDILRSRGLPVSGNVETLQARLAEADAQQDDGGSTPPVDLDALSDEDLTEHYKRVTGDTTEHTRDEMIAALDD